MFCFGWLFMVENGKKNANTRLSTSIFRQSMLFFFFFCFCSPTSNYVTLYGDLYKRTAKIDIFIANLKKVKNSYSDNQTFKTWKLVSCLYLDLIVLRSLLFLFNCVFIFKIYRCSYSCPSFQVVFVILKVWRWGKPLSLISSI